MIKVDEAYKNHIDMIEKPIKLVSELFNAMKWECVSYSLDNISASCEWHKDDNKITVDHLYEDDRILVTINGISQDIYYDDDLKEYILDMAAILYNAKYPEWLREDD